MEIGDTMGDLEEEARKSRECLKTCVVPTDPSSSSTNPLKCPFSDG